MWLNRGFKLGISRQFSTLPTATLNQMMKTCLQEGHLTRARDRFDENPSSRNVVSWNIMIAGYVKNNHVHIARQLFYEMPERDIVSWNTLLSGLQKDPDCQCTYDSFLHLQRSGLRPNQYTFSIVITTFLGTFFDVLIPQLHAQIVSLGYNSSVFVGSALMRGYTHLGDHSGLCRAFQEVLEKGVSVWNALILGHMELGFTLEALRAFNRMPERNVVSWTTMIDGYLRNKQIERARCIFDKMNEKNVVSWTAMISGYVRLGKCFEALELFPAMMRSGTRPNQHTFSSILAACAGHSELLVGEQVHASIVKHGVKDEIVVLTALVDVYAKCGNIEAAFCVFKTMPKKNLASWNTIVGGFARHGLARRALRGFEEMVSSRVRPDQITFVHVLSACGHGGHVVEGEKLFLDMEKTYGVPVEKEHYACMVDLYGRAGLLDKAKSLISNMPFVPDVVVWGALLGACTVHSNSEFSSDAAEAILNLEKDNPAAFSLLSKIHGEKGVWSSVTYLKNTMKEHDIKKHKAGSRIT